MTRPKRLSLNPKTFFHYPRWLLLSLVGALLLIGTALVYSEEIKNMVTRYTYQLSKFGVKAGTPEGYEVAMDYANTYVYDFQGKPIIHFGGWSALQTEWAKGSQITSTNYNTPLLGGVNVRWYSLVEDQFYEARFDIDKEWLMDKLEHGEWSPYHDQPEYFIKNELTTLIVNTLPGGKLVVWISGAGYRTYLLGQVQAKKTDMDWQTFADYTFKFEEPSRSAFRERVLRLEDGEGYDEMRKHLKQGTLPLDAKPWLQNLNTYPWRLKLDAPYEMRYFFSYFFNGEYLVEQANSAQTLRRRAVPENLSIGLIDPKTNIKKIVDFDYDRPMMREQMNRLSGPDHNTPVTVTVHYKNNQTVAHITLESERGQATFEAEILGDGPEPTRE